MRSKISTLLAGAVLCAAILPATNLFGANNIDKREHREQMRIDQGVRSGELTPKEFNKLENQQARIRVAEARAKADGNVTPKEKAHIEKKLNQASREIYRAKHN
jgi:tellurite resistance protein